MAAKCFHALNIILPCSTSLELDAHVIDLYLGRGGEHVSVLPRRFRGSLLIASFPKEALLSLPMLESSAVLHGRDKAVF